MSRFEDALLESGSIMRRGYSLIHENSGKLIALITAAIAILLTFAEVGLPNVIGAELGADLMVMLAASYIIYFSIEDAGERLGRECEAYKQAEGLWRERAGRLSAEAIGDLRDFCIRYSRDELNYRRLTALMAAGLTEEEYLAYLKWRESGAKSEHGGGGTPASRTTKPPHGSKARRALRRISRMKPISLSPATLIGGGAGGSGSELKNPERHKIVRMLVGLLPTTVCMLFTVSMMITAKSGLDAGAVISGIVKLSTLPMIAMRGYSHGYDYSRLTLPAWMETKAKLIDAFLSEQVVCTSDN